MENKETIKIYKNYSKNNKKFYLSTKVNEEYYYINKSHNDDLYLDMDALHGKELSKELFKLKEKGSKILIFKDADKEREFCITKEEIEKRKQERKKNVDTSIETMLGDILKELIDLNALKFFDDGIIAKLIGLNNAKNDDLQPIEEEDEDLPF